MLKKFSTAKGKRLNPYKITLLVICQSVKTLFVKNAQMYQVEINIKFDGLWCLGVEKISSFGRLFELYMDQFCFSYEIM